MKEAEQCREPESRVTRFGNGKLLRRDPVTASVIAPALVHVMVLLYCSLRFAQIRRDQPRRLANGWCFLAALLMRVTKANLSVFPSFEPELSALFDSRGNVRYHHQLIGKLNRLPAINMRW